MDGSVGTLVRKGTDPTGGALEAMITIKADFDHMDEHGRLLLADLVIHDQTPFAEIAARREPILFTDGDDVVRGSLAPDASHGWVGIADWSTQDLVESYPRSVAVG